MAMFEDSKSGGSSTESTKTETEPSTSTASVGFWDPALQEARKRIIYLWGRTGESILEHFIVPKLLKAN
jgi:plasmid replication initiation protein